MFRRGGCGGNLWKYLTILTIAIVISIIIIIPVILTQTKSIVLIIDKRVHSCFFLILPF